MDSSDMILLKGEIKTADIVSIKRDSNGVYWIRFKSGKSFPYSWKDVCILKAPKEISVSDCRISNKMGQKFAPSRIWQYKYNLHRYYRIEFPSGMVKEYDGNYLNISDSALKEKEALSLFNYLKEVSAVQPIITEDGTTISLHSKYERIDFVDKKSALGCYLYPESLESYKGLDHLLYPFYSNLSQMHGVDAAFKSQVSVIQGPPGTGKTQTILNIVANILSRQKNVLIVSNNNSAVKNVKEKLEKEDLGFVVAELGKKDNRTDFIAHGQTDYPDMSAWEDLLGEQTTQKIEQITQELITIFEQQNRLAEKRQELTALKIEQQHFYTETHYDEAKQTMFKPVSSDKLIKLWVHLDVKNEKSIYTDDSWFSGVKSFFQEKVTSYRLRKIFGKQIINQSEEEKLRDIKALFYRVRRRELESDIERITDSLKDKHATKLLKEQATSSMQALKASLYLKYQGGRSCRPRFTADDLWKRANDVAKEYPVVLSTTYSALSSLPGHTFDYLIIDEASQIPLESAALAMYCAKNAIIVGDLKQLPNIITDDVKEKIIPINEAYKIDNRYNSLTNSFLSSVIKVFPNIPKTLLREHYRCAPMIINFCNQKYYGGDLLIMTEADEEIAPMKVIKTVQGNHARSFVDNGKTIVINQREVDELISLLGRHQEVSLEEIGVVTPFRGQANLIHSCIHNSDLEVDTIHKYQGREKDSIIMSTVVNSYNDFVDNPNLINVAVSRAKRKFVLITNGNENAKGNLSDLIDYVEYNHCKVVNSQLHSIFDLLYASYAEQRQKYLQGKGAISEFDSENIAYNVIDQILKRNIEMANLEVKPHYHLNSLINDTSLLTEEEAQFAHATWSHIDFLIENRVSKKPVLAIEVDGFAYHYKGTKQSNRDLLKDSILSKYGIPILRLSTAGSGEVDKIEGSLKSYLLGIQSQE